MVDDETQDICSQLQNFGFPRWKQFALNSFIGFFSPLPIIHRLTEADIRKVRKWAGEGKKPPAKKHIVEEGGRENPGLQHTNVLLRMSASFF